MMPFYLDVVATKAQEENKLWLVWIQLLQVHDMFADAFGSLCTGRTPKILPNVQSAIEVRTNDFFLLH